MAPEGIRVGCQRRQQWLGMRSETWKLITMTESMMTKLKTEISFFEPPALFRAGQVLLRAIPSYKILGVATALLLGSGPAALANDNRLPDVPGDIAVPVGNTVHFHGL